MLLVRKLICHQVTGRRGRNLTKRRLTVILYLNIYQFIKINPFFQANNVKRRYIRHCSYCKIKSSVTKHSKASSLDNTWHFLIHIQINDASLLKYIVMKTVTTLNQTVVLNVKSFKVNSFQMRVWYCSIISETQVMNALDLRGQTRSFNLPVIPK